MPSRDPSRLSLPLRLILAGALMVVVVVALDAQTPTGWDGGRYQRELVPSKRAGFTFCRLAFPSVRSEPSGRGWDTDYPMADRNLMIRLGEFTTTTINEYEEGDPAHAIVRPTDPELFECPFLFASDIGTVGFTAEDALALRAYFLKGGFLWVDDFWGERAMEHWLEELELVLPGYERVILTPDHPLFSTYYFLTEVPQIPNIGFWRRNGGDTSERGAESAVPTLSGILDEKGQLMILMSHNTDIADGWEREAEDYGFFSAFSPHAYAVAMNVAVHAMTR